MSKVDRIRAKLVDRYGYTGAKEKDLIGWILLLVFLKKGKLEVAHKVKKLIKIVFDTLRGIDEHSMK